MSDFYLTNYFSSAAKISTRDSSLLGAQPKYMHKLLTMVEARMATKTIDITMKFTLSALWNLTGYFLT